MSSRYIDFLVDPTGKAPKNLADSIRRVSDASVAFVHSWLAGEITDAVATSQEAFQHLAFIQEELLRQRDVQRQQTASWPSSPLKTALAMPVGHIVAGISEHEESWFRSLVNGRGALPAGLSPSALTLETALAKLKHRDNVAVNFSVAHPYEHRLHALISAGMGQATSLIEIDVPCFCKACKAAAVLV